MRKVFFSSIYKIWKKKPKELSQWLMLLRLKFQAIEQGGRIEFGNGLKIEQEIIFQGRGLLQLKDEVMLGYELGGSPSAPILLQPREIDSVISIGRKSILVNGTEIIARNSITIGENCRIGARCIIIDSDFHGLKPQERNTGGKVSPVTIGNNVWLGLGVIILKGVTIGDDAVIGAGSIVTRDIPEGGIAVGNPVRIIGSVYDS